MEEYQFGLCIERPIIVHDKARTTVHRTRVLVQIAICVATVVREVEIDPAIFFKLWVDCDCSKAAVATRDKAKQVVSDISTTTVRRRIQHERLGNNNNYNNNNNTYNYINNIQS